MMQPANQSTQRMARTMSISSAGPSVPRDINQEYTVTTNQRSLRSAQHMTIAGSFLDFALFIADVEHLKFIIDSGMDNVKYSVMLVIMLVSSLILQIVVVILMFWVGFKTPKPKTSFHCSAPERSNNNKRDDPNRPAEEQYNEQEMVCQFGNSNFPVAEEELALDEVGKINHIILFLVTVIAILNVFVTVFGDRSSHINHMQESYLNSTGMDQNLKIFKT